MSNYKISTGNLTLIGLTTAIICILGPIAFAVPFSPVPVSLGLLAVMLATRLLGARLGFMSCLIYILVGLVGLPVFSGFTGGIGVLLGPTGGYLLGYLFLPLCTGMMNFCKHRTPARLLGMLIGLLACYFCGTLWLSHQMEISFGSALLAGVLPYLPLDLAKQGIAWFLGGLIRKRLNKAGLLNDIV
ncbi:MAG: biotin transporter BioY [Lachnospiraceae bacterium]|nr:biotin transporter BioY [Lachnospiraceae bacterium]